MSFEHIIGLWPSVPTFARDIGVQPSHAHVMKVRNSIPPRYWPQLVKAASQRDIKGVTFEALALISARDAA